MFFFWHPLQFLSTTRETYLSLIDLFCAVLTKVFHKALILKFRSDVRLLQWVFRGRDKTQPLTLRDPFFVFSQSDSMSWDYIYYFSFLNNRLRVSGRPACVGLHSRFERKYVSSLIPGFNLNKLYPNLLGEFLVNIPVTNHFLGKRFLNFLLDLHNFLSDILSRSFSFGFVYMRGLLLLLFADACLTDDEPLWEPIEWSLVQSWILVVFIFAWIAENLIVSRYGSYTGRDKRVWFAWYKTFWLVEGYYIINYGVVCMFVIVPFYYETNYNLSFVYSWWHWYSRVFFFKFISLYTLVLLIAYFLQVNVRWLGWKKSLVLILLVNVFLAYLLYTHFIMTFFAYFTDPTWYQKTRPVDYVQLSHEPARWGWGPAKKDHFTYHGVKTVLWFKNDGPFATSFLLFQTFLFVCLFMLYIYWVTLLRRVYSTSEVPLTLTTYCVSSLKQFFYFFLFFYVFIFFSYVSSYARFPIEFLWSLDTISWFHNFTLIIVDYPSLLLSIFLN